MAEAISTVPTVTVILPAHNEVDTIAATVRGVRELYPDYEVIVVDDASTDGTGTLATNAGARVIRSEANKGYGGSLKRGIRRARGKIIVFMDADGQHDAKDVRRLVERLEDCDMVVGQRSPEDQVAVRKPGKWLLEQVARFLIGREIPDLNSGLRALYRKDGMRFLPLLPNGFSLTTTITLAMMRDGCEVHYIPIRVAARSGGTSRVNYVFDGIKTLLLISRVTMLFNPLKVFAPVSFVLLGIGGVYTLLAVILAFNIPDGSILLLLSGLLTLLFGLLADQVASIRRGG